MSGVGTALYTAYAIGAPAGGVLYASYGFAAVGLATVLLPLATVGLAMPLSAVPRGEGRVRQTAPVRSSEEVMDIKRVGSQPSGKGPAEYFTGTVRIDPLFQAPSPARVSGAAVTFEPGARTAWHTHPLGQTLIVTAGSGRVQRLGGPIDEIKPGDVVWFPPGEKHWHGAAPTTALTHIAVQEQLDGKAVEWLEQVSDDQYQGRA